MADPPVYWDPWLRRFQQGGRAPTARPRTTQATRSVDDPVTPSRGGGLTYDRASGQYRLNGFRVTI